MRFPVGLRVPARCVIIGLLCLPVVTLAAPRIAAAPDDAGPAPEPAVHPEHGFYHPDADRLFDNRAAFLEWYADRERAAVHHYDPERLNIGIATHRSLVQAGNLAHVDALVREIERRGHNALVLAGHGAARFDPHLLREGRPVVDVLLYQGEMLDFEDQEAGRAQARALGVPLLMALGHHRLTADEYRAEPGGLAPDLTPRIVNSERDGMLEPIVVSARDTARGDDRTHQHDPMPGQVQWRVARALAWARLRRADNADKRVVFSYWSEAGSRADIGGDPDDFLDVQGTLATLLTEMRARGYDLGADPLPDAEAIAERMHREAHNVGGWAPGALDEMIARGEPALIPESRYLEWYAALPEARRNEIEAMWGPPPGRVMVHTDADGERFLVIPRLQFGNVLLAPHPVWGYLEDEKVLLSKDALPPHHQYLAFFLWLQKEFDAHAWISLFSNITLQPGKGQGPLADDHVGILLGGLPHIHPERLGGNGGMSTKRKAMGLTASWYSIVVPSDTHESLGGLRELVARTRAQGDAPAREAMAPSLREAISREGLDRALDLDPADASLDDLLSALEGYFDELDRASMPWGSKILGTAPDGEAMTAMVAGMLGSDADDADPDEVQALARSYAAALREAPREVQALFDALNARWLEPGPVGEPFRRPEVLPPGRALYNFDQRRIPTVEAEAVGVRQAEALIAAHRDDHDGAYPESLAFVLWSSEVAKNNGITEAQILHLLGTRAVRNRRGEVTGVELIPREELGRPRVDVLISASGVYRNHFLDKINLITEATALAAQSDEPDNPVARTVRSAEAEMIDAGMPAGEARQLALARVFSAAPGAHSPSIQFLARSGDQRGDEARMAELYTRRMSHAYGGGLYGAYSTDSFRRHLARMNGATLPRSSDVNGLLDHPMSAAFLGGLNLAAKAVTGDNTPLYISNLRDPGRATMEHAARALQTELRTRYFNPAWLRQSQRHGYEGARTFMFMTDHLDLWNSTAEQMVSSADWAEVKAVFVDDRFGLDMDAFFDRHNPFAQQMLITNLLGAARRGHWDATAEDLAELAERLVNSVMDHGPSCDAGQCRDAAMTEFVGEALEMLPDAAPLLEAYTRAIEEAVTRPGGGAPGAAPEVTGQRMEEITASRQQPGYVDRLLWWLLGLGVAVLLISGWLAQGRPGKAAGHP